MARRASVENTELAPIDAAILALRERLGVGFHFVVCGTGTRYPFVGMTWTRLSALKEQSRHANDRRCFRGSITECVAYANQYEDTVDALGEEEAHAWHRRQRAASEAEYAALVAEKGG